MPIMQFLFAVLAVLSGFAVVALVVHRPKIWIGFSVYAIIFGPFLSGFNSGFGLTDEFVILATFVSAVWIRLSGGPANLRFPGLWFFVAFAAMGSSSAILNNVEPSTWLAGLFLATKSVIFGWSVLQLPIQYDVKFFSRILGGLIAATVTGVLINVAIPGYWFEMFSVGGGSERGGIQSPVGFMVHPGYLAQIAVLLAIAVYVLAAVKGVGRGKGVVLLLLLLAIVILTLRRKALVALVLVLAILTFRSDGGRVTRVLLLVFALVLTGATVGPELYEVYRATVADYLSAGSAAPRTLLYRGSSILATDYFPFGAGFGRFGTAVANDIYSPEYVRLGFTSVYGLAPGDDYGQDAFWPGALGEAGWLGATCYLAGLISIARYFGSTASCGGVELKTVIAVVSLGWWIEFAVESLATPVYLAAPLGPLLFLLVAAVQRSSRESLGTRSAASLDPENRAPTS